MNETTPAEAGQETAAKPKRRTKAHIAAAQCDARIVGEHLRVTTRIEADINFTEQARSQDRGNRVL